MSFIMWGEIDGFPKYRISNKGVLVSYHTKTPRIIKPSKDKDGYPRVVLSNNNKKAYKKIYHLVLESFVGERAKGQEACHNDGNKDNNHLDNLRWDTPEGNMDDRYKHGKTPRGSKNNFATLTEKDVLEIKRLIEQKISNVVIAKRYGVQPAAISKIRVGRSWGWLDQKFEVLYG